MRVPSRTVRTVTSGEPRRAVTAGTGAAVPGRSRAGRVVAGRMAFLLATVRDSRMPWLSRFNAWSDARSGIPPAPGASVRMDRSVDRS
ncbi:hypothetical protein, partial [Frankia sp. CiP3]|uniref:hypothetical protein n=1 Tax=Frankia sp. CiP3 TaxID=2880971 RepID=UPI001EF738ED